MCLIFSGISSIYPALAKEMDGEQLSQNKHREVLKCLQLQRLCSFSDHNMLWREKKGGGDQFVGFGETLSSSSLGTRNEEVEIQLP